jgi:hypothetical protein
LVFSLSSNLRESISESGIDNKAKKALIDRFDDINDLSEIFTEISNDLMGSFKSVESYIAENPDNDSNNMRRNNILRKYYNDKKSLAKPLITRAFSLANALSFCWSAIFICLCRVLYFCGSI